MAALTDLTLTSESARHAVPRNQHRTKERAESANSHQELPDSDFRCHEPHEVALPIGNGG